MIGRKDFDLALKEASDLPPAEFVEENGISKEDLVEESKLRSEALMRMLESIPSDLSDDEWAVHMVRTFQGHYCAGFQCGFLIAKRLFSVPDYVEREEE